MKKKPAFDAGKLAAEMRGHADTLAAVDKRLRQIEAVLWKESKRVWEEAIYEHGEMRITGRGNTRENAYPRRLSEARDDLVTFLCELGMKPTELRALARRLEGRKAKR
jgi:hypothetical protein